MAHGCVSLVGDHSFRHLSDVAVIGHSNLRERVVETQLKNGHDEAFYQVVSHCYKSNRGTCTVSGKLLKETIFIRHEQPRPCVLHLTTTNEHTEVVHGIDYW